MLKRLKVWSYLAMLAGAALFDGCSWGGWWPYNTNVDSMPRIITAILREDIFG
jgi:hypothetical protein